jgi:hypothetical protein
VFTEYPPPARLPVVGAGAGVGVVIEGGGMQTPASPSTKASSAHGHVLGLLFGGNGVVTTLLGTQKALGALCLDTSIRSDCPLGHTGGSAFIHRPSGFSRSLMYPVGHVLPMNVVVYETPVGVCSVLLILQYPPLSILPAGHVPGAVIDLFRHWTLSVRATGNSTFWGGGHGSEYIVLTQHLRRGRHSGNTTADPLHRCVGSLR